MWVVCWWHVFVFVTSWLWPIVAQRNKQMGVPIEKIFWQGKGKQAWKMISISKKKKFANPFVEFNQNLFNATELHKLPGMKLKTLLWVSLKVHSSLETN